MKLRKSKIVFRKQFGERGPVLPKNNRGDDMPGNRYVVLRLPIPAAGNVAAVLSQNYFAMDEGK